MPAYSYLFLDLRQESDILLPLGVLIDGKKQLCQSCKVPLRRRSIPIFFRYWRMCILNVKRNVCALFVLRRPIIFCLIFRSSSQQENNNLLQLNTHDNRTCCDLIKNYIYNSGFVYQYCVCRWCDDVYLWKKKIHYVPGYSKYYVV